MGTTTTPLQGLPIPDNATLLKELIDHFEKSFGATEKQLVLKVSSMTALGTITKVDGMLAYVQDVDQLYLCYKSVWTRIFPPAPAFYTGSGEPASSTGAVGDFYVKA